MSNVLTGWRSAVQTYLDTNLQSGSFTVTNEKRDGPSHDRKLCCLFFDPTPRDSRDPGAFIAPRLIVRAWLPKPKQPKPRAGKQTGTAAPDPEPIEQLEMDLWTVLTATRELPAVGMYFEVMETVQDLDDWGVQATLVGWVQRPLP